MLTDVDFKVHVARRERHIAGFLFWASRRRLNTVTRSNGWAALLSLSLLRLSWPLVIAIVSVQRFRLAPGKTKQNESTGERLR